MQSPPRSGFAEMANVYETQDESGVWHEVTPIQAAAYRLAGIPTRVSAGSGHAESAFSDGDPLVKFEGTASALATKE